MPDDELTPEEADLRRELEGNIHRANAQERAVSSEVIEAIARGDGSGRCSECDEPVDFWKMSDCVITRESGVAEVMHGPCYVRLILWSQFSMLADENWDNDRSEYAVAASYLQAIASGARRG